MMKVGDMITPKGGALHMYETVTLVLADLII